MNSMIRFLLISTFFISSIDFSHAGDSDSFVFEGSLSSKDTKEIYSAICISVDSKNTCKLDAISMGNSSSRFSKCAVFHRSVFDWNSAKKIGTEWVSTTPPYIGPCNYEYTYRMSKKGMVIIKTLSNTTSSPDYCDREPYSEKLKYHKNYKGIEFNIDGCKSIKMGH